jgi:hypothetical protein
MLESPALCWALLLSASDQAGYELMFNFKRGRQATIVRRGVCACEVPKLSVPRNIFCLRANCFVRRLPASAGKSMHSTSLSERKDLFDQNYRRKESYLAWPTRRQGGMDTWRRADCGAERRSGPRSSVGHVDCGSRRNRIANTNRPARARVTPRTRSGVFWRRSTANSDRCGGLQRLEFTRDSIREVFG